VQRVYRRVISQVTSLTPSAQVVAVAILGRVIQVRDSEHNFAFGNWMWFMILSSAFRVSWRTFATVASSLKYLRPKRLPVPRVAVLIFRSYRH